MAVNKGFLEVFEPRNVTSHKDFVTPKDLPKYWNRDYIVDRIERIKNYKHKMLMKFLWMTGIRISEALSIKKKHINFEDYVVTVNWQKSTRYKTRNVPLHPEIRNILQLFTVNMKCDDRIFPITRQHAWRLVKKYLGGHPHKFRHSFAVNWLRCGGAITVLSKMLGHSDLKTTMIYTNIVPVDQGKELLKIKF